MPPNLSILKPVATEDYGKVLYRTLVEERLGLTEIDAYLSFAIEYHVCAIVEMTRRWLLSGKAVSAEEHCARMMRTCPKELISIITANDL